MSKKLHTVDDASNAVIYAEFEEDAKRVSDPVVGICGNYPIWNPPHCGVCLFWKYINGIYGFCRRRGKFTARKLGYCKLWEFDFSKGN